MNFYFLGLEVWVDDAKQSNFMLGSQTTLSPVDGIQINRDTTNTKFKIGLPDGELFLFE